jgi:hypothetical protein
MRVAGGAVTTAAHIVGAGAGTRLIRLSPRRQGRTMSIEIGELQ